MSEQAILARLRSAGLAGPSATARLFAGGFKNRVWMIEEDGGRLVAKVYMAAAQDDNPYYPNRPADEALALRHLAGKGLAPDFVAWFPEAEEPALLVYRHVDGPTWRADAAAAGRLIVAVHAVPPPPGLRHVADSPAALVDHGEAMLARAGLRDDALMRLRPRNPAAASPSRATFLHTDCGPGNIIVAADGLRLIDWQCPALGDPAEDIACFLSPAMMTLYRRTPHAPDTMRAFLAAYGESEAKERYRREASAWHWRIACYCRYRAATLKLSDPAAAALYAEALAAETALLEALAR